MNGFSALADPTRRRIVEALARGPLSSGDIAKGFDVTPPAISQHLKALRAARLVRVRAMGQRRIYELDGNGISEIEAWLKDLRRFWTDRFDALEIALQARTGGDDDGPQG